MALVEIRCLTLRGWWLSSLICMFLSGSVWTLRLTKGVPCCLALQHAFASAEEKYPAWLESPVHWTRCLDLTLSWTLTLAVSTLFQLPKEQCWTESRPRLHGQSSVRLWDHWRFRAPLWSFTGDSIHRGCWLYQLGHIQMPTGKSHSLTGPSKIKLLISSFMSDAEADCILTCDPCPNLQVGEGTSQRLWPPATSCFWHIRFWAPPSRVARCFWFCVLSLLGEPESLLPRVDRLTPPPHLSLCTHLVSQSDYLGVAVSGKGLIFSRLSLGKKGWKVICC